MKRLTFFLLVIWHGFSLAQSTAISGIIVDEQYFPMPDVKVSFSGQSTYVLTDETGYFRLPYEVSKGEVAEVLLVKNNHEKKRIPVNLSSASLDLGSWILQKSTAIEEGLPLVDFTHLQQSELDDFSSGFSFPLQAQRTPFVSAMAFQFSAAFFSARGLNRSYQPVRINGILMNDLATGRAPWAQWGGLNAIVNRSQQFQHGLAPLGDYFSEALGQINFELSPLNFQKGIGVSQAFSNQNYSNRQMVHYHSGLLPKGYAYSFLASRRGGEGRVPGTLYRGYSFFASLARRAQENDFQLIFWYAPHWRGKRSPLTDEVVQLLGKEYNPYWGIDEKGVRNARVRRSQRPHFLLHKSWQLKKEKFLQLSTLFVQGEQADSRITFNGLRPNGNVFVGGGRNPSPIYYQNLPSYYLRHLEAPDFLGAYFAEKQLQAHPQMNWTALREANINSPDGYARYAQYEDVVRQVQSMTSLFFRTQLHPNLHWRASLSARIQKGRYYAQPVDLLGAKSIYDLDPFAEGEAQNNNLLYTPRAVDVKTPFLYHYKLRLSDYSFRSLGVYTLPHWRWVVGGHLSVWHMRREGLFQNGRFPQNSFGFGPRVGFTTGSIHAGVDYNANGRHHWAVYGQWSLRPMEARTVFPNPRENNHIAPSLKPAEIMTLEMRYRWQLPWSYFEITAYAINKNHSSQVNFYYADGVEASQNMFVQELMQGMSQRHRGIELGWRITPIDELSFDLVAAVGRHRYGNNPNLWLYTAPNPTVSAQGFEAGKKDFGRSQMRNYFLGNGPQQAFALAMQYNDPDFWRFNITGTFFAAAYLPPNPLRRTASFFMQAQELPLPIDLHPQAWSLLDQEQLPSYFLLNAFVNKSWKYKTSYFGFFLSAQNLLNKAYKTGGFEQGRNAHFQAAVEDQQRDSPLFGPRYWWGRGSTFFASLYFRF